MRYFYIFFTILTIFVPSFIWAESASNQEWWRGGTARTLSLGNIEIAIPDSSTMIDLYSQGHISAFFDRKKENMVSLSADIAYIPEYANNVIIETYRAASLDSQRYMDNFISVFLSNDDFLILKPFVYEWMDVNSDTDKQDVSSEVQYGHSFGDKRVAAGLRYLQQSSEGISYDGIVCGSISFDADTKLFDENWDSSCGVNLKYAKEFSFTGDEASNNIMGGGDVGFFCKSDGGRNDFFTGFYLCHNDYIDIFDYTASLGIDIKAQFRPADKPVFSFELGVDNKSGFRGKAGICILSEVIKIPLEIKVGDWTQDYYSPALIITTPQDYYNDKIFRYSAGIEFTAFNAASLRFGINDDGNDTLVFSSGIGFDLEKFTTNLSVVYYNGRFLDWMGERWWGESKNIKAIVDIKYVF